MTLSVVLVWVGMSSPGLADLRIVSREEGEAQEMLLKDGRVSTINPDGSRFLIDCLAEQITMVSPPASGVYWQGSADDLARELEQFVISAMEALQDAPEIPGLDMSSIFGSSPEVVAVRVNSLGRDSVAGYDAAHYQVQYRQQDGDWETYEDLWVSEGLLREAQAEVGSCMTDAFNVVHALASFASMGMGPTETILTDPAYRVLLEEGFPVRSHTRMQVLAMMTVDVHSEVVEVNRNPIPADLLQVPSGYRQVDTVMELFEF